MEFESFDEYFDYIKANPQEYECEKFQIGEVVGIDIYVGDPTARAVVIDDYNDHTYCIEFLTDFLDMRVAHHETPRVVYKSGQTLLLSADELIKVET